MSLYVHTTRSGDVRWQSVCKARVFCRTFGPNLFITPRLQCGMWTEIQGFQSIRNQVHLTRIWFLLPLLPNVYAPCYTKLTRTYFTGVSGFVDSHFIFDSTTRLSSLTRLFFGAHRSWQRHPAKHRTMPKPTVTQHGTWHNEKFPLNANFVTLTCQQNAATFKFPSWLLSCSR